MLTPTSSGQWNETILHQFDYQYPDGKDGEDPYAGVIIDHGRVFGTTALGGGPDNSGIVFALAPRAKYQLVSARLESLGIVPPGFGLIPAAFSLLGAGIAELSTKKSRLA
jgi:hypothetical protein